MSEPAPGSPRGSSARRFAALMKKKPALRGVVFDRAHILPSALQAAEDLGLHGRFSAVAGDFFTSVPPADLYLLKLVLHDWSDDACISILKNCRRAIHPGGRIVAVEMLIGEIGAPGFSPLIPLPCAEPRRDARHARALPGVL